MELTKKDQRHIEEDVESFVRKLEIESTEYARLYELTYLRALVERIQIRIAAIEYTQQHIKNTTP